MQRILLTGGCGFIGSNFVKAAHRALSDARLVCLDKLNYAGNLMNLADLQGDSRFRFVKGDISDEALLERIFSEEHFDTVINFAAESHVDRSILESDQFVGTNVLGTHCLLQVARKHWGDDGGIAGEDRRFLQISTDEVFGELGETGSFRENSPYQPRSPYSASKAAADHLTRAMFHTHQLPVLITNCSNNYGPFQFPEKLIPLAILNAKEGRSIPIYGDGQHVRDWLFVSDHCSALLEVLARGRVGETYCIGGNCEKKNLEVVEAVCDLVDELMEPLAFPRRELITHVSDRPGHDRRYAIDTSKISTEFDWRPSVDFEEGLRKTVEWYLSHEEWLGAVTDGSYREFYDRLYGDR